MYLKKSLIRNIEKQSFIYNIKQLCTLYLFLLSITRFVKDFQFINAVTIVKKV